MRRDGGALPDAGLGGAGAAIGPRADPHSTPEQGSTRGGKVRATPQWAFSDWVGVDVAQLPGTAPVALRLELGTGHHDGSGSTGCRRRGRSVPRCQPDAQANHPRCGAVDGAAHRTRGESRGAGRVQFRAAGILQYRRTWQVEAARPSEPRWQWAYRVQHPKLEFRGVHLATPAVRPKFRGPADCSP